MTMGVVGQQIINALALGSVYAMIAVGLAMIYGVLRVLHIAHAGVYTAGAYLGLLFFNLTGSFALAVIGAMIVAGLLGALIERFIYRPMLPKPRIVALIASIGIFICLSDLFRILAGPHQLAFEVPAIAGRMQIAGLTVSGADFLILGGTAVIFAALWFLIQRTQMGFAIRAVAQDIETAKVMGIDVDRSVQRVFFLGSAIAAFGGIMVAILYSAVYTSMGDVVGYKGPRAHRHRRLRQHDRGGAGVLPARLRGNRADHLYRHPAVARRHRHAHARAADPGAPAGPVGKGVAGARRLCGHRAHPDGHLEHRRARPQRDHRARRAVQSRHRRLYGHRRLCLGHADHGRRLLVLGSAAARDRSRPG